MKKVLATILALVMAIGLCSVSWATDPAATQVTETTEELDNGSYIVNGEITLTNGALTVKKPTHSRFFYVAATPA